MSEATMTSKGQITVPKEVRDALRLRAGDRVFFLRTEQGYVLKAKNGSVKELGDVLKDHLVGFEMPSPEQQEINFREAMLEKHGPE